MFSRFVLKRLLYCRTVSNIQQNKHDFIQRSPSRDTVIPEKTIPEVILSSCSKFHKYTAIECVVTGKKYTYEELQVKTLNMSGSVRQKLKLQKGDVAALILDNSPDFPVCALGLLFSDVVVTTVNPRLTTDEISKLLTFSKPKIAVTKGNCYTSVKKALERIKLIIPIIIIKDKQDESLPEGTINFEDLIKEKFYISDIKDCCHTDLAFLPFSSGTTGLQKGVKLTHYNIVANLFQSIHDDFNQFTIPPDNYQDNILLTLPMFHIFGFTLGMFMTLMAGAKIVSIPKFTPEHFIAALNEHLITHIYGVPPLILFMTNYPGIKPVHFESMKFVQSGGAPLAHKDELKFLEKANKDGLIFGQGYGQTETSPGITAPPKNHKLTPENGGSIGRILPNTIMKVIAPYDDKGKALGPNEEGELLFKGPQVFEGYYNNEEESKKSFLDGWFKSGDIGYYNEDGYVFITDRIKSLIKVKGFQVAPAEVEGIIRTIPNVVDAAIIGVPHQSYGEVPRAYVELKENCRILPEDIKKFVSEKVVDYKHLTGGVEFIDAIPRNPTGKILKRVLLEKYLNEMK